MGIMKLYNRSANGFTSDLPLGGLPVYSDDLKQLEDLSMLYGVYSMLRGWSCVLSGCYVDDLNTATKTLSMTEGLVLLNDIVYYIPPLTNQTYPFSIVKGSETIDSRFFLDGTVQDVAINYDHAIKTSFSAIPSGQNYPGGMTVEEIYFDPFTSQRSEYILQNINKSRDELLIIEGTNPFTILKTETGKNIIGGGLNSYVNNKLKWKYYGYTIDNTKKVLRSAGWDPAIVNGGSDTATLTKGNIPQHVHDKGTLTTDERDRSFFVPQDRGNTGDTDRGGLSSRFSLDSTDLISTKHAHAISGNTGNGLDDGLLASPNPINILPAYRSAFFFKWTDYRDAYFQNGSLYRFWSGLIKYNNM